MGLGIMIGAGIWNMFWPS
jgi:FtsH-binding integral membrane protein